MEITFWYFNVFWNKMIQEANYVFIGVLNILANNLAIIQYSFHSCLPFLYFSPNDDFLQQILNFFQLCIWNSLEILIWLITYQATFDTSWSKHDLTNGYVSGKKITRNQKNQCRSQCTQIKPLIFDVGNYFVKQTKGI